MANMSQAIRLALHYGEKHLDVVDIFGEDVGPPLGGVFTATQGLDTSWNTPLDERGIVGMAIGIAMTGSRCVAEIQFVDYIFNTIDLLKIAGNTYWSSNGQINLPMVLMTPTGAGIRGSIYHSHSFDSIASRLQGWKVVMPSTPIDAYGLLISAIKDNNPVMFLKPKALLRVPGEELLPGETKDLKSRIDAPVGKNRKNWKPNWPDMKHYSVPIGKGKIVKKGKDLTIVTYGRMVNECLIASKKCNYDPEIIDLRSLYPYDWQLIKNSILKTKKVLLVNEDTDVTNFGEHIIYRINEELFYEIHARPKLLAGKNVPGIGLHNNLETASVPGVKDIVNEINNIASEMP